MKDFNNDEVLNTLNQLTTFDERIDYLKVQKGLKVLGNGSSRVVFLYEGYALKLAFNDAGLAQNDAEYASASFYGRSLDGLFARVPSASEDATWILMELCETVTPNGLKEVFGEEFSRLASAYGLNA